MENINQILSDTINQGLEQVLRGILSQILDRPPVPEDARELTLYTFPERHSGADLYWGVAYKGSRIGLIKIVADGPKFTITFHPDDNDNRQTTPDN